MNDAREWAGERLLLRIGGVAAIVGTIFQVAAGSGQSAALGTAGDVALEALAAQPDWLWPVVYLGFIFGALLWVGALVALAATLTEGAAWALARLAVAAAIIGATLHTIDGTVNAVGLAGLANAWEVAPEAERAALAEQGELVRRLLEATWAGVITLFHGVPFVLAGLAVVASGRYPALLGWVGLIGGVGSVVVGIAMMVGAAPAGLAVPFAVVLSLFMVVLGWLLWVQADRGVAASVPASAAA